jgi:hypothetical protein
MMRRHLFAASVLCAALALGAGCNSTTAPDIDESSITPAQFTIQTFAGTLGPGGSLFYSFVVNQQGPVSLTLAAVQTPGGAALTTPVGIGIGVPQGTGCPRSSSLTTPPGLSSQLSVTLNPGTYCAAVYDVGTVTGSVNFAMRIRYP